MVKIFKAELIKTRRTYGFLATFLIPILIAALQFSIFYFKHEYFAKSGMNPWQIMGSNLFNFLGIIVMPMYVVLISYLINFTEHQSNSWKFLFSLPLPKFKIYSGKIMVAVLWLFLFCLVTALSFLISGALLSTIRPDVGFQDYDITNPFLINIGKMFLSGFGILSIQFLMSIYWKDFIRPVGIGLAFTIAAMILSSWDYIYIFPYSHPLSIRKDFSDLNEVIFTTPILFGLAYAVIFFFAGYYLVSKKEIM